MATPLTARHSHLYPDDGTAAAVAMDARRLVRELIAEPSLRAPGTGTRAGLDQSGEISWARSPLPTVSSVTVGKSAYVTVRG